MINYEIIILLLYIARHALRFILKYFRNCFPLYISKLKCNHNLEYLTDAYFSFRPIKRMDVLVKNEHKKFKNYKTSIYNNRWRNCLYFLFLLLFFYF